MVAFGFGEIIGGLGHGVIIDKLGSKMSCLVNALVILTMTGVTLTSIIQLEYNVTTFAMCFMWGAVDGVINVHTFQILGFEFDNPAGAFSCFNLM